MRKPDPSKSANLVGDFDDLLKTTDVIDNVERLKNVGNPLFTVDDIYAVEDEPSQLFRSICVENNITEAYFNEKYRQYAIDVLGMLPQEASNNRANNVKMLKQSDRLSWKKFLEFTLLVLGLRIKNISVTLENLKDKKVQSYTLKKGTDEDDQ